MRVMLDTVILIYLLHDEAAYNAVKSAAEAGTVTIVLTHIQVDQVSARPSEWERLSAIPHEIQPTHAAVYDRSVYGGARYGDAGGKFQEIMGQGRSVGNLDDALIGVSLSDVDIFVTNDDRLTRKLIQQGLTNKVWGYRKGSDSYGYNRFLAHVQSLQHRARSTEET